MLYPMFAMVILTFIIGVITLKTRFASVKNGDVKAGYYRLMDGQDVPNYVTQTTRAFNNQFEVDWITVNLDNFSETIEEAKKRIEV